MPSLTITVDRGISVSPGHLVVTGYVHVDQIVLGCRDRMAVGDVEAAYRLRLQLGDHQPWPPPRGEWREDGRFVVIDGRHSVVAAMMLGIEHVFVAWEGASQS